MGRLNSEDFLRPWKKRAWGKLQMSGFRNKSTSRKKGTSDKITGMFRRTETVLGFTEPRVPLKEAI